MLKVGDIFEAEDARWVVLEARHYDVRYDMFSLYPEPESAYFAMKLSKTGKPLKSVRWFYTESGSVHYVSRQVRQIGKAKVNYIVSDVNLTDSQK